MIKIDFSFDTKFGVFSDALYLDDNHVFTEEEINAMKQQRLENWLLAVNSPSEPIPTDPPVIPEQPQESLG